MSQAIQCVKFLEDSLGVRTLIQPYVANTADLLLCAAFLSCKRMLLPS